MWTNDDNMCYGAAKDSEALHHASTVWKDRVLSQDMYWKMEQRYQNAEWREDARRDARPLIQAQANEMAREQVRSQHYQGYKAPEGYALGEYGYDMRGPAQWLNYEDGGGAPPPPPPPAGVSIPVKGGVDMYPMPPTGSAAEQAHNNAMVRSRYGGARSGGFGYGGGYKY